MDVRSEEGKQVLRLRKRSRFVFGFIAVAQTRNFKVIWILIVLWIGQFSSNLFARDWFTATNQTHSADFPVTDLADWSVADDAFCSLTVREPILLPVSHISPDEVFHTNNEILKPREQMDCTSSGLCTETKCEIPWSCWDRNVSACQFVTHDLKTLFLNLDNDFVSLWKLENVVFVGAGLGLSLGLRGSVDDDVREYTAAHPKRWGNFTDALGVLGNTETQIAGMAFLYGYAYHQRDKELMDFTRLMVRSYTMTGLSTLLVKGIANTDRPSDQWNNGRFGFPSAHVSTSFAIAATIEEYYGPEAGVPAYLMAGLIGWSRIDDRDHDLSDVVFGAVLGYAIAKSIAGQELRGDSRIRMFPWMDPGNSTLGAMWEIDF